MPQDQETKSSANTIQQSGVLPISQAADDLDCSITKLVQCGAINEIEIQVLFTGLLETGEMIKQDNGSWIADSDGINDFKNELFSLFRSDLMELLVKNQFQESGKQLIPVSNLCAKERGKYVKVVCITNHGKKSKKGKGPSLLIGYEDLYIPVREIEKFRKGEKDTQGDQNSFRLKDDRWYVKFKGEEADLVNLQGVKYLVHLLEFPQQFFDVKTLYGLINGTPATSNMEDYDESSNMEDYDESSNMEDYDESSNMEDYDESRSTTNDNIVDVSSYNDKETIKNAVSQTWNELKTANIEDIPEMEDRYVKVKEICENEYKIAVKETTNSLKFIESTYSGIQISQGTENARTNIQKRIKRALKEIEKKLPALAQHLEKPTLSTGCKCIYNPLPNDSPMWQIYRDQD